MTMAKCTECHTSRTQASMALIFDRLFCQSCTNVIHALAEKIGLEIKKDYKKLYENEQHKENRRSS